MNEQLKILAHQAGFYGDQVFENLEQFAQLVIEHSEMYKVVDFIARDYVELSHDKVQWQRNDWRKRCQLALEEYHRDNDD